MISKIKITDDNGYRLIDVGMERNTLVYDGKADAGYLTKYVVYHVRRIEPKITDILVAPEVFIDFIPIDFVPPFPDIYEANEIKCFGITINYDIRLNRDNVWFTYFKNRGGSLAHSDEHLVLCYYSKDEYYTAIGNFTKDDVLLASC